MGDRRLGHRLVEEPGVGPHPGPAQPLGQGGHRPGDERRGLGPGVVASRAEVGGQHHAGLGPHHRVRPPRPLAGVVVGDALLLRPIDLDVGGVEVDRGPHRCQDGASWLGQRRERPAHEHAHGPAQVGDGDVVEASGQGDERRRRRGVGHGPQGGPRLVGPGLVVQVAHEVAPGQHGLGHRQDQLAGGEPLAAGLNRPHARVDGRGHAQDAVDLGHQDQACRRGERRVLSTDRDRRPGLRYGLHPTGAFRSGRIVGLATPILLIRKALVADGPRTGSANSRI